MCVEKAFGIHAVEAILQQSAVQITEVWVQARPNKRQQSLLAMLEASHKGATVHLVESSEWEQIAPRVRHQGILIAYTRAMEMQPDLFTLIEARMPHALILIIDGVVDPSNLGACIRSAAAFSVDAVIIPKDKAAQVNETVRKVAAGGVEQVPVYSVTNVARTMDQLAKLGVWFYGCTEHADLDLQAADFSGAVGVVMGAEAKGLRELTMRHCDHLVKLPTSKAFSTLNVSVATGIALYEVVRQQTR